MTVWEVFCKIPYGIQMMVKHNGMTVCRNFGKLKGDKWDWIDNIIVNNIYQYMGMVVVVI